MRQKIITIKEVCQLTGKSRTTIWRWRNDGIMPASVRLGPNSVGFYEAEIMDWLESLS